MLLPAIGFHSERGFGFGFGVLQLPGARAAPRGSLPARPPWQVPLLSIPIVTPFNTYLSIVRGPSIWPSLYYFTAFATKTDRADQADALYIQYASHHVTSHMALH